MERNKLINKRNSTNLSIKRTLRLLTSGFTTPIQPVIIETKTIKDNTIPYTSINEINSTNENHIILGIIEKSILYLRNLFNKKGITSKNLDSKSNTMQILEDAVSFKQPSAGSSKYVNYLNKLKFIE